MMVSPINPAKLLFYLFLINLSLLVKVAFGYDCDPAAYPTNQNPASYCTDKKNGFTGGTWFGNTCRAVGSTSDCECSCTGDYYILGIAVSFKCASSFDGDDHHCFKKTTSCIQCNRGSYRRECGCSSRSTCSQGYCEPCPDGTYSPSENTCPPCNTACDTGKYISKACQYGGTDIQCTACAAGYYCDDGKKATICPIGSVCPSAGLSAVTWCSTGQNTDEVCDVTGLTAPKLGCIAGKRHQGSTCEVCTAGTYISEGFHLLASCNICPAGKISATLTGSTACIDCQSGKYSSNDESWQCSGCVAGSYQTGVGTTACIQCEIGTYKSNDGSNTPCDNCKAGTYAAVSISATGCSNCVYGTYSNIDAQTVCRSCYIGKTIFVREGNVFKNGTAIHNSSSLCKFCDAGYYTCNERDGPGIQRNCIFGNQLIEYCIPCPLVSYCPGLDGFPKLKTLHIPSFTFISLPGTDSTDNIISNCTTCKHDEYEMITCGKFNDVRCTPCSKPTLLKTYVTKKCSRFDNTEFGECRVTDGHLTVGGICNPCLPGTKPSESGCEKCAENTFSVDGKACNNCTEGTGSGIGASMCTVICSTGQFSHDGTSTNCKEIESASVTRIAAKWDGLQSVEVGVQMVDGSLLVSNTIADKGAIWLMGIDKAWGVAGDQSTIHTDSNDGVGSLAHFGKITAMATTSKSLTGMETFLIADINSNYATSTPIVKVRLLYFEQYTGIFSTKTLNILNSENKILQPAGLISSSTGGDFFLISDQRAHCVFKVNYNSVTDSYNLIIWRGRFEQTVVSPAFKFLSSGSNFLNNPSSLARLSSSDILTQDNYLVLDNYVIWSFSSSVQPSSNPDLNYVCGTTEQGLTSFPMRCDQLNIRNVGVNAMTTAVKRNSETIVILSFLSPNGQGILSFTPTSNINSLGSIVHLISSDFASKQRITNIFAGNFNVFVTLAGEGNLFNSQVLELGTHACLCDAGYYCHAVTNNCVQTPVGTYTSSWSPKPIPCKVGTVSKGPGGKDGQSWCSSCNVTSFTTYSLGALNCENICYGGQILNRELKKCVDGCNVSSGEYFDFDKTCKLCPLGSGAVSGSFAVGPTLGCPLCPILTRGIRPGVCEVCPSETTTIFTGSTICMPAISKTCVDGIYGITDCSLNDDFSQTSSLILSSSSQTSFSKNNSYDLIKSLAVTSGGTLFLATGSDIWKIDRSNSPLSNKSILVTTNNQNFISIIDNSNRYDQVKIFLNNSIFEVDFPLELIEVSDDGGTTIFTTQIGQNCIWKLVLGDEQKTISEPWVGVCGSPGDMNGINGAARLGSITNMALMEYEGRTSILYVSTMSSMGCATIRSISLFDGSVSTFLGFDALQMPVVLSLTCPEGASPFILSIPRGSALLYYASGANVYLAQVYEINNSTGEINAPSIEISLVNPISAICSRADGTLAMIEGKTGDLTISTTSGSQSTTLVQTHQTIPSFMNLSTYYGRASTETILYNDRMNFAWVGRHMWYTVYSYDTIGKKSSSMIKESSLSEIPLTSGSCIGGYISTVNKACFQVGSGRYSSAYYGVVNCKGGTYSRLASGAAGSSHLICKDCPIGSISSEGAIICSFCPVETPYASQDATTCVSKCPGGSFLQFDNNDTLTQRGSCKSCPSGYSSVGGIRSIAECSQCAAGTYSNAQTFGICAVCPTGWTSMQASHNCIKICAEGTCSVDGNICTPKTSNWELMTSIQLEPGASAWSVAVANAGGVFYTDNNRIIYFLDDCPARAKLSDWGDNCKKSGENILPDLLCDRCNRGISAMVLDSNMVNDGITTKRYLYVASKKTHSIYKLPIIYSNGIVDVYETKKILKDNVKGTTTLLDYWLLTGGVRGFLDGTLSDARFNSPSDIQISSDSKYLFISDFSNNRIRMANLTSQMVSTVLGAGAQCWRYGTAKCPAGSAAATCDSSYSSSCASIKWPLGIALSDDSDNNAVSMYLAMNTENAVGILSNVLSDTQPSTFSSYCALLFDSVGNSIETCNRGASSKSCMLKEAYDVKVYSNSLYVLFKNGLTRIELGSGKCQQIIGSYWDFTQQSGGFVDAGISDTTHTSDARVDAPFRLSIAKDRGILYIADLNNGAIRRVFINGQCRCPEGSVFVSSARSCYNPTQKWSTREIIKCPFGHFALEGEVQCRSCLEADVYNIETVPSCVLWKQGITAGTMQNIGFPYAKILGNPVPSTAIQSDWYGSNPPYPPSWDDIFRKDSPVMYNLGPTNGRAPWGSEFSTYTYDTETTLWVHDTDPALKPILLLPGFWHPCTYENENKCRCSKLISNFEMGQYGSDLSSISTFSQEKKTWETLRMAAVDSEGKVLGSSALLTDFADGSFITDASYNIHAWSKFMIVGTRHRAPDTCSMHKNGPCFPGFEHIHTESTLSSYNGGNFDTLVFTRPIEFKEITCSVGWPAHYMCSNGYVWVAPNTTELKLIDDNKGQIMEPLNSQIACLSCLPGTFSYVPLSIRLVKGGPYKCQKCKRGEYSESIGSTSCRLCPSGTYSDREGSTYCKRCEPNHWTKQGAQVSSACSPCAPGTGSCQQCSAGQYQDLSAQNECVDCPPGSVSFSLNSTACSPCENNTYQSRPSMAICDICGHGTQVNAQHTACIACKPSLCGLSLDGICGRGCGLNFYWNGEECVRCIEGFLNGYNPCAQTIVSCQEHSRMQYIDQRVARGGDIIKDCPFGSEPKPNKDGCDLCIAGKHGSLSNGCEPCPPGYFSNKYNQSECEACAPGKYANYLGSTECIDCTLGSYSPTRGTSECFGCSMGHYAPYAGFTACLACDNGTYSTRNNSVRNCEDICDGSMGFFSGQGASSCTYCDGGLVQGGSNCVGCGLGMYENNNSGIRECKQCPQGLVNRYETHANNVSICVPCPLPIEYSSMDAKTCLTATIGHFPNRERMGELPCSMGTYRNYGNMSCEKCEDGHYSDIEGQIKCLPCMKGYYRIGTLHQGRVCSQCGIGFISEKQGSISCTSCPGGHVSNIYRSGCDPCGKNTYQSDVSCEKCEIPLVSETGSSSINDCKKCPTWTVYNLGTGICTLCSPGSFTVKDPVDDSLYICVACSVGTQNPNTGSNSSSDCNACGSGYIANVNRAGCITCPIGQKAINGTICEKCPIGSFSPNGTVCTSCEMGKYSDVQGQGYCKSCSPGSWSNSTGQTSCVLCNQGTFSNTSGSTACSSCRITTGFSSEQGSTACIPRKTTCNEGYYMILQNGIPDSDHLCERCGDCAENQYRVSYFKDVNPEDISHLCPGNYTFPGVRCVDNTRVAGVYFLQSEVAGASAYSDPSVGGILNLGPVSCSELKSNDLNTLAYVIGPSAFKCYVACLYGIKENGLTVYQNKFQDVRFEGNEENIISNVFYTRVIDISSEVCTPCPLSPCQKIGTYRPFGSRGGGMCGPACALPEFENNCTDPNGENNLGCYGICKDAPPKAEITGGSGILGSDACPWKCNDRWHLNEDGDGCLPCAKTLTICSTGYIMIPENECLYYHKRQDLCKFCDVVEGGRASGWNSRLNKCTYACFSGYYPSDAENTGCISCNINNSVSCPIGMFRNVYKCMVNAVEPACSPCTIPDNIKYSISFTTHGGILLNVPDSNNTGQCSALCNAGYHTTISAAEGQVRQYVSDLGVGSPINQISCVICTIFDDVPCKGKCASGQYRNLLVESDSTQGACVPCTRNDQCLPGWFAPVCSGNGTANVACIPCNSSLLTQRQSGSIVKLREFVSYEFQKPNTNIHIYPAFPGACPSVCINNFIQGENDASKCISCDAYVKSKGCESETKSLEYYDPLQPKPCDFRFSHWNALPDDIWWDTTKYTPTFLQGNLFLSQNTKYRRAGLCWACPLGKATSAEDGDLCMLLDGYGKTSSVSISTQKIAIPSTGVQIYFATLEPQMLPSSYFESFINKQVLSANNQRRRLMMTLDIRKKQASDDNTTTSTDMSIVYSQDNEMKSGSSLSLGIVSGIISAEVTGSPCKYGFYKAKKNDELCTQCPYGTSTVSEASIGMAQCLCYPGWFRNRITNNIISNESSSNSSAVQSQAASMACIPCPVNTYRPITSVGEEGCRSCPPNETTHGRVNTTKCSCIAGFVRKQNNICEPCEAGSYCTPCVQGYTCPQEGVIIIPCFKNSTSPSGSISMDNCSCLSGLVSLHRSSDLTNRYCVPVPPTAIFNPIKGQVECKRGWTAQWTDGQLIGCFLCSLGKYAQEDPSSSNTTTTNCVPCPLGSYSGTLDAVGNCTLCPYPQTTQEIGSTRPQDCGCPPPTTMSLQKKCEGCVKDQYLSPLTRTCENCPLFSIAKVGATSASDCICIPGYNLDATKLACIPCELGKYSSHASNGNCKKCPRGSTTSDIGSKNMLDCSVCLGGYILRSNIGCILASSVY